MCTISMTIRQLKASPLCLNGILKLKERGTEIACAPEMYRFQGPCVNKIKSNTNDAAISQTLNAHRLGVKVPYRWKNKNTKHIPTSK